MVGAFNVDPDRNCIWRDGKPHQIEPLIMDVLMFLIEHAGKVVTRDQLIEHVWFFNPGADESLTRAISILRAIFNADKTNAPYITTIWKRGYALVAETRRSEAGQERRAEDSEALPRYQCSGDFSVGVLPFQNMSGMPEDAFLADGITRDLTMLLSRVPRLHVAAYSSALAIDEGSASLPDIAASLGVRYVVSGSLQRRGDEFQLRTALMDGVGNTQVWAERIESTLDQFFEVQDKIVLDVSTSTASALVVSHARELQSRRQFQLNAYQLVQRAENLRLNYNRSTAQEIVQLLDRAVTLQPDDAAVHAALAVQLTQNVTSKFDDNPSQAFAQAKRHVETAISFAPDDPDVLAAAGITATMMGNARLAVRNLTRAVERDPNNPHTLAVLGWQHCWLHGNREGLAMIETAEARAPHHPRYAVWAHYRGHCEIRLGNVDAAIAAYRECDERNPDYSLNLVTLAAALAFAGRDDEARRVIDRIRLIAPDYTMADFRFLVDRMIYWFGSDPSGDDMVSALGAIWDSQAG
ncbi:winged helix-turn-helix domain-containing protein [Aurantiacibacter rhizosphaerae]|uniref:Tetratricopeptide repeat protein n=1 Tax=Aurantiacibacter rhizosphaerae TaxID=2691582 RepID=A0A844XH84_9SPHN|nr:winged helix-turn-helix domain-containing protein [Aurantiacibacter rhizosphaerae]MWV28918.1 tetratricopeptide repeat protein [Aurantiacibacter rhizosphaerae]